MKLALHGYGKMGKEVERLALERGWSICARIDLTQPPCTPEQCAQADAVIHFASANGMLDDLKYWGNLQKPLVIGTTGWYNSLSDVQSIQQQYNIGIVYAANFSLGVNLFYAILRTAGTLINRFHEYDVFIHEYHHKDKADSPSGTALSIGKLLLNTIERKKELLTETSHGKIHPHQLHITSTRGGTVIGTHIVTFDSFADTIEIMHAAKNRSGFALGALLAAEWIKDKKGLFTFEDIMNELF
ncbi:MAG: 4-hydroxy-tetrahydrodipicolinate reductase [Bacteroidetes bacterium]|nr:4-hydroxy-tetrahydrodipicolinate reductase [Bacteroidota bacterium]